MYKWHRVTEDKNAMWGTPRLCPGAPFINYLPEATDFLTLLFADDTTFQVSGVDLDQLFETANSELENLLSGLKRTNYL